MELDSCCTDVLKVRHQCWCGLLWIFKRLLVSPLGRQRSLCQNIWFLTINIHAIVSSIIAKIFSPSKYWTVTFQLLLNDTLLISDLYCLLPVILVRLLFASVFIRFGAFCSIRFFCSVFKLFSVFSVLILEMYSRYFDPVIHQPSSSQ